MNISTQISGHIYRESAHLHTFTHLLIQLGIQVAYPDQDESFFYKADLNAAWRHYNRELEFYESIASSSFHVLYNDGPISDDTALEILYAVLKNRPIVVIDTLVFAKNVSSFGRDLIMQHAEKFHMVDVPELELSELNELLRAIKPIDYHLLGSERLLISAQIKAHFRALLEQTKQAT